MVEQLSFLSTDGGSIPTSSLQSMRVKECMFEDISHIFRDYHYKRDNMGGGIMLCLSLVWNCTIIGGVVVGKLRHDAAYSTDKRKCIELRRMACIDDAPKNTESYFLSKVIWFLRKHTDIDEVISYSDLSVGHVGTIYKAANFKLLGETAPSKHVFWKGKRYHPRSLTIDRAYSYQLREALKNGEATVEIGKPKLIYSYKIVRG